jgi:diguanylate cyclase (GGDEF)-like protein/PAS domain S-box-containing protein
VAVTGQLPTGPTGALDAVSALVGAPAELLVRIISLAPIGVGLVDPDGRTVVTNDALRQMLGYSEEEFAELDFRAFTHPDDVTRNDELFAQLMAGSIDRFDLDKRFLHRDGHVVWGRLLVAAIETADDAGRLAIGLLQDVTEQQRLQAELAAAEASYRLMVEQVPAVVYAGDTDPTEPPSYVSPRLSQILGYEPGEWSSRPGLWLERLHSADREAVLARYRAHLATASEEPLSLTYRLHRRDGEIVWVRDQFTVTTDDHGRRFRRGVLVDVTREKRLEEELEHQAFHDPLTQLANLRLFRIRIDDRLRRRAPRGGAVVFLDLDDFKTVNDSLGHGAGDRLLQEAARRIVACLRPADTGGRLGGDEFAILIDEVDGRDQAELVAERVRLRLSEPYDLAPGHGHVVTGASVGVAMLTDGDSTEEVLRAADLAMYAAKDAGKSRVRSYEPAMLAAVLEQLEPRRPVPRS